MVIDVDSARQAREAARREAGKTGPVIKLSGEECQLPAELPYEVLEAFGDMDDESKAGGALAKIVPALLGEHYSKFQALKPPPSLSDVEFIVKEIMSEYGVENPLDSSDS
jgi:hypothetical protein